MMRRVWMLAAVLALAGCMSGRAAPEGALPMAFAGSWEGRGTQSDQPGEWTIAASIVGGMPGGIIGTIAYPSLGCGGELRLHSAAPRGWS